MEDFSDENKQQADYDENQSKRSTLSRASSAEKAATSSSSRSGREREQEQAENSVLGGPSTNGSSQNNLPEEVASMGIILRFLQLLCENHNDELQNYLRVQPNNKQSYNLVCETLQFLECICGSTTGGLGLLGLWINEHNVHLINQTLESLTEYCQGPCHENQYAIINHESNGIDIVIALILNDIQPLSKNNVEMFLALKDNASKLLLAVMESNDDTANAERIMYNITPKALFDVIREAYEQGKEMDHQAELRKSSKSAHYSRHSTTGSAILNHGPGCVLCTLIIREKNEACFLAWAKNHVSLFKFESYSIVLNRTGKVCTCR